MDDIDENTKPIVRGISNVFDRRNKCLKNINKTTKSLNTIKSMISNNTEISIIINQTIDTVIKSNKIVKNISDSFITDFSNLGNMIMNDDNNDINNINNINTESISKNRNEIEKIKSENLKCQMDLIEKKIGLNTAINVQNEIPKLQEEYTNKFKKYYKLKQENLKKINEIKNKIETLKQLKSNEITKAIIDKKRDDQVKVIREKYDNLINLKKIELNKKEKIFTKNLNELELKSKKAKKKYENKVSELKKFGDLMGIKDDKKLVKFLKTMSDLLPNLQEISLNIEQVDVTTDIIKKQIENKFNDKIMIIERFKISQENIGIYDLSQFIQLFVNQHGFIFMRDLSCKNKDEYNNDILNKLSISSFIQKNNLIFIKQNLLNTLYKYCIEFNWKEYDDVLTEKRDDSIKNLSKCITKLSKQKQTPNKNVIVHKKEYWKDILQNKWYLSHSILSFLDENYSINTMKDIKKIKSKKLKQFKNLQIGEIKRFKWNKKIYFKNDKKKKKKYDKSDELPSMDVLSRENDISNIINKFKQENIQMSSWKLVLDDIDFCKQIGMKNKDIKKLKYLCNKLENDYNMKFDD